MEHAVDSLGCRQGLISVGRLHGGDRTPVLEVFEGLSERSRRLRFHGPKPRLGEGELEHLVDVGRRGREAVAAVDLVSGSVVGTARFVRDEDDPAEAEVAFEVVDDCQGHGVGRRLVAELSSLARHEGIERFRAEVVAGNHAALALVVGLGRLADSSFAGGVHELVVELDPPPASGRSPLLAGSGGANLPRPRAGAADARAA